MKNIADLGTILGIWAHPDDEAWACGGVMAEAVKNGQKVACITATKGAAGQSADPKKWPTKQMAEIREAEMNQALDIIGVRDFFWLDYEDGQLAGADKDKAVAELVKLIDQINPDTIITFEPQGITGHDDHKTVCAWACAAAKQSKSKPVVYGACETRERYESVGSDFDKQFNIYFRTTKPFMIPEADADLAFELSPQARQQKLAALKAHESQTANMFKAAVGKKYFHNLSSVECFTKLN